MDNRAYKRIIEEFDKDYKISSEEVLNALGHLVKNEKVFVCGLGSLGRVLVEWIDRETGASRVLVDQKERVDWTNEKIISYDQIINHNRDKGLFLISSKFFSSEIRKTLIAKGVNKDSIIVVPDSAFDAIYFDYISGIIPKRKKWINNKFKDIHKGKRAFLIGNGPSLELADLELLKNEITFATNEIDRVFSKIKWRPTYYLISDRANGDNRFKNRKEFENMLCQCGTVLCEMKTRKYIDYSDSNYNNLFFYKSIHIRKDDICLFSEDVCRQLYAYGTTMYEMYQFAIYMGIKEVFLLGSDCSYRKTLNERGEIIINSNQKRSHPEFLTSDEEEKLSVIDTKKLFKAHEFAKEYADARGIKIYNATRGGMLEIFPRVDLNRIV